MKKEVAAAEKRETESAEAWCGATGSLRRIEIQHFVNSSVGELQQSSRFWGRRAVSLRRPFLAKRAAGRSRWVYTEPRSLNGRSSQRKLFTEPQVEGGALGFFWARRLPRFNLSRYSDPSGSRGVVVGANVGGSVMSDKKVQCVPGGHEISLEKAYWCDRCRYYVCYSHANTSILVNTVKCPKGHEVTKAKWHAPIAFQHPKDPGLTPANRSIVRTCWALSGQEAVAISGRFLGLSHEAVVPCRPCRGLTGVVTDVFDPFKLFGSFLLAGLWTGAFTLVFLAQVIWFCCTDAPTRSVMPLAGTGEKP